MASNTTNYSLIKPAINDPTDQDLWGGYLNTNFDTIDGLLKTANETTLSAAKTANYTITSSDRNALIRGDASGGAFDFDLPTASSVGSGFLVFLKKVDSSANAITIDPSGVDTVDVTSLAGEGSTVAIISDGTSNWVALGLGSTAASDAEVIAGAVGNEFIAPKFYGDNNDLSATGYQKFPGGLIMQWGTGTASASGYVTVTFPVEFTSFVTFTGSGQTTPNQPVLYFKNKTLTSVEVQVADVNQAGPVANNFDWIAIGV